MQMPAATRFSIALCLHLLLLSACSSSHRPAPVITLSKSPPPITASNSTKRKVINSKYYIVKKGDTLYSIAFSAGKDFKDLARINAIEEPYAIYPGKRLTIIPTALPAVKNINRNDSKPPKKVNKQKVENDKKTAYIKPIKKTKTPIDLGKNNEIKKWIWPTEGKIINRFSLGEVGNKGIDISGEKGDAIIATAGGKVVYIGDALRGYGKLVIVKHSEHYLSAYAHNDAILVQEQQRVKAGQLIARKGKSDAEQVMLHFEIRYKGKSVDPLRYLPKRG